MKQIKNIHMSHLLLGAHVEFHWVAIQAMEAAGISNLRIDALFPTYKEAILLQKKHLNPAHNLANTPQIRKADEIRDFYIRRLLKTAKDYCRSPVEEEKREAIDFWRQISVFDSLPKYEMTKESALTNKLLEIVGLEMNQSFIEKTGLSPVIKELGAYQELFDREMDKRLEEQKGKVRLDKRMQRKIIDKHYREIVLVINAYAVISPDAAIEEFIDLQNANIDEFKHILSGMRRGGSRNKSMPPKEN